MPRAARLRDVQTKATTRLADQVRHLRARGLEPINLATARPDFDTPWAIKEAAREALAEPHTYIVYSESRGLIELREAIARKLRVENGVAADPGEQVLVTAGTHEAISVALQALLDPGDEVVLVDPSWVAYQGMVRLAGGVPRFTRLRDGRLDEDDLRAAVSPRTKAILVNNPNNPTGTVFTREELGALARVAQERGVHVIVDEIYEHFLYDGREHVSLASLPGMAELTLTVNGVSKAFAMTGWRIGYAAGPTWWVEAMLLVHQHFVSAPCTFAQKGAVAAFTVAKDAYREMVSAYARRRDALAQGLSGLGLDATPPEGACFYFPRFPGALSSQELSDLFLERAGIMLTPGSAFGPSGEGHLRLSFASLPETQVPEVVGRMEEVMEQLAATSTEGRGRER